MSNRRRYYSEVSVWKVPVFATFVLISLFFIQYAFNRAKKISKVIEAYENQERRLDSLKVAKNDTIYYIIHPPKN